MKRILSSLTRTGRIGRATLLLIVLGVFLTAGTASLFLNLRERQRTIADSVREDAMWAVFQTDREASRLIDALYVAQADTTSESLQNVVLRFDLMYSRGKLLHEGQFAEKFSTYGDLDTYAKSTQRAILSMADVVDPLLGQEMLLRQALPQLLNLAKGIRAETTQLVIATNRTLDALRVSERNLTTRGYNRLALGVLFMTIVFVSIVALQFAQLVLISKTKRKLRHLSLRNARSAKAARAASDAKTRFLATMSHEIRTPLNGIIGATDLLGDTALSDEQKTRVSTIRRSGDLLLDVITDILDYSKLEADAVTYSYAPVFLPDIAAILDTVLRPRAEQAGLRFEINFPACEIVTDAVHVRQVLVNLIGNAVKFTKDGGISIAGTIQDNDTLRLTVTDTGIGIAQEDQDKLFKDFSQIDNSASRRFTGTGLGLAISKRIVTDMGGTIGVSSAAGAGCVFWVDLPVTKVIWRNEAVAVDAAPPDATRARFAARVLVVEDNEINQDVATAMLERFGVVADVARNGQHALDRLTEEHFDLVFMDLQMPILDGIEATIQARRIGVSVPIVGLTANAFEDDRQSCMKAGMDDYVVKPITSEKIQKVLTRFAKLAEPASPVHVDGSNLVDAAHISSIVAHTGKDTFLEMLRKLRSDVDAVAAALAQKGAGWESEERDAAFHAIKGAALTLGLSSLGDLAQELRCAKQISSLAAERLLSTAHASFEVAGAVD